MAGSEVLAGVAAAGIAALISDTTKTGSRSALGKAIQIVFRKNQRAILQASGKYIQACQASYGQLNVLGMHEPVTLSSVYTEVKLIDRKSSLALQPAVLTDAFRQNQFQGYAPHLEKDRRASGMAMANQNQYLMVLGESGAGKSAFLQKVGLDALRTFCNEYSAYNHRLIPVLLELKRLEWDDIDIEQFIVSEFEKCGFPAAELFVQNALTQGNLLILLDGLDELPSAQLGNVLGAVHDFINRYDGNRFIVTCRVAAAGDRDDAFQQFRKVTIAAFDDEQIQQFIFSWFSRVRTVELGIESGAKKSGTEGTVDRESAQKCWEALSLIENQASKALAHTPLLLTYLCLLYSASQRFPSNRSYLYQAVLLALLENEPAEARLLRSGNSEGLTPDQEERLLAEIAYEGMVANQPFLTEQELLVQVKTFLAQNLNEPIPLEKAAERAVKKAVESEAVLKALVGRPGLFVEKTEGTYAFSHLMLQAYLTAQYLVNNPEWEWLIQLYLTDRRWREVFLLLPGLMSDPQDIDKFLLAIEDQSRVYLHSHHLQQLLYWAETSVQASAQDFVPQNLGKKPTLAAKRIAAVFLARALTRALDLASDLDIAPDLGLALDLDLSLDLALALALAFARALAKAHARACALEVEVDLDLQSALGLDLDLGLDLALVLVRAGIFLDVDLDEWVRSLEDHITHKPQIDASRTEKQQFIETLDKLWFSPFGLEAGSAMLSQVDSQALLDYFYACELMICCKEGALNVCDDLWAGIESRIFTGVASSLCAA